MNARLSNFVILTATSCLETSADQLIEARSRMDDISTKYKYMRTDSWFVSHVLMGVTLSSLKQCERHRIAFSTL